MYLYLYLSIYIYIYIYIYLYLYLYIYIYIYIYIALQSAQQTLGKECKYINHPCLVFVEHSVGSNTNNS